MSAFNWLKKTAIPWFTGLGLTTRTVTLEVPGRKTGRLFRVSLSRTDYAGSRYFVSLAGEAEWVKNVRVAAGRAVIISRRRTPILLKEIPPELFTPCPTRSI